MSTRIILGNPGNGFQFKISRPGKDAISGGIDDLLINSQNPLLQVVQRGIVNTDPNSGSSANNGWCVATVNCADQGFLPLVLLTCQDYLVDVGIRYFATSQFQIATKSEIGFNYSTVQYIVTNQRFN